MNVYDFDRTICRFDSSTRFFRFCLRRMPCRVLRVLPGAFRAFLRYRRGGVSAKALKEKLFSFLRDEAETEALVRDFWQRGGKGIQDWYLRQRRGDDLIVSASPEFLLRPVAEKLGFRLIGTRMDAASGRIEGENCHDGQKVLRLRERFPNAAIEDFYSDSLSDAPLAALAGRAFLVSGSRLTRWPEDGKTTS